MVFTLVIFLLKQLKCFIILMVDDFHNIHSLHTPAQLVQTNIVHMASCLADVHPTICAVPRPVISLHRQGAIKLNGARRTCTGGIDVTSLTEIIQNVLEQMNSQFLDQLPSYMQKIDPRRLQAALRELR